SCALLARAATASSPTSTTPGGPCARARPCCPRPPSSGACSTCSRSPTARAPPSPRRRRSTRPSRRWTSTSRSPCASHACPCSSCAGRRAPSCRPWPTGSRSGCGTGSRVPSCPGRTTSSLRRRRTISPRSCACSSPAETSERVVDDGLVACDGGHDLAQDPHVLGVRLVARERLPRVVLAHECGVPVPLDARAVGIDAQRAQARDGTHEWLEGLAQGAHAGGPGGLVTLEGEQDDVANHETPPRMSDQFR